MSKVEHIIRILGVLRVNRSHVGGMVSEQVKTIEELDDIPDNGFCMWPAPSVHVVMWYS